MNTETQTPDAHKAQCIAACLNCHQVCLEMALTHCLKMGGKHTEPEHFRTMLNCAEMCLTAAHFMMSGSDLHRLTCRVCSEICNRCAESCEGLDGMESCVTACRTCAQHCAAMAS